MGPARWLSGILKVLATKISLSPQTHGGRRENWLLKIVWPPPHALWHSCVCATHIQRFLKRYSYVFPIVHIAENACFFFFYVNHYCLLFHWYHHANHGSTVLALCVTKKEIAPLSIKVSLVRCMPAALRPKCKKTCKSRFLNIWNTACLN